MTPELSDDQRNVTESLIRLEAKIDVVLGRHEAKIDDLTRRQGETTSTLREHDSRITANALTVAEVRTNVLTTREEFSRWRTDVANDIDDAKPKNLATWVAVAVASLALVLTPILTAVITR